MFNPMGVCKSPACWLWKFPLNPIEFGVNKLWGWFVKGKKLREFGSTNGDDNRGSGVVRRVCSFDFKSLKSGWGLIGKFTWSDLLWNCSLGAVGSLSRGGNIPRSIHDLGRALVSRNIRVYSSRHDIRESPFEFLDELVVWLLRSPPVEGVSPSPLYAVSGTDTQYIPIAKHPKILSSSTIRTNAGRLVA